MEDGCGVIGCRCRCSFKGIEVVATCGFCVDNSLIIIFSLYDGFGFGSFSDTVTLAITLLLWH